MTRRSILSILFISFTTLVMGQDAYSQLMAKDWAKLKVYEQKNSELTTSPEVVFFGDSITQIWFDADSLFFTSNNFADRGISGQTTCGMLVRFRQDVINLKPKAVVILAGTNDIALNDGYIPVKAIADNIFSMCELAMLHGIDVIICSTLPCSGYKWRPEVDPATLIPQLNELLKEYAQANGIAYLDYFEVMNDGNNGLKEEYTYDKCHPTPKGFEVMKQAFFELWKSKR